MKATILTLTFLTGISGLIYEVTWQKYLANILGSQAKANTLILTVFLGFLSFGYIFFGKWSKFRSPHTLTYIYGIIEICIGAWSLIFLILYFFLKNNSWQIESQGMVFFAEFVTCVLLISLPAFLMGSTLPFLTQAFSSDVESSSRWHAFVYYTNTIGAFCGVIVAGFILVPSFGLKSTLLTASAINIFCGLCLVLISKKLSDNSKMQYETKELASIRVPFSDLCLSFINGFVLLALQTITLRTSGLVMGSSEYTFSISLAAFLFAISMGAFSVSLVKANSNSLLKNQSLAILCLVIYYLLTPSLPYVFFQLRSIFLNSKLSFYSYYLTSMGVYIFILLVGCLPLGRTLPLIFSKSDKEQVTLGGAVGKIYGSNTLGCIFGALVGGYFLLFLFNLDQIFKFCMGLSILSLSIILFKVKQKKSVLYLTTLCLSFIVFYIPNWNQSKLNSGLFRYKNFGAKIGFSEFSDLQDKKFLAYKDDPNTSVAVGTGETIDYREIFVNAKSDGATFGPDFATTRMVAHLPMMLKSNTISNAAIIGFGTGNTAGALSLYPEINKIHVVEISNSVKQFASFFDFSNNEISKNPKLTWHIQDAFRFLSSRSREFQLIISEPSNPWVLGVERLYSLDFYKRVHSNLNSSGIYVQWFHLYEISPRSVGIVLKTFSSVFENIRYFKYNDDIILVGSQNPLLDLKNESISLILNNPKIRKNLNEAGFNNFDSITKGELQVNKPLIDSFPIHTLEKPILSYSAEYDFFSFQHTDINYFKK